MTNKVSRLFYLHVILGSYSILFSTCGYIVLICHVYKPLVLYINRSHSR